MSQPIQHNDVPIFISDQSLSANAFEVASELFQMWELQPFYLDEDKPLHQLTLKHDPSFFRQYLRIPSSLLPPELSEDSTAHPPKRYTSILKAPTKGGLDLEGKKEAKKMLAEEDANQVFDDEDFDDYNANKFEDYDQENDDSGAASDD
ncbi:hypothetical protein EIN_174110 [Entamoeba invadens IP1]|uniref:Uncharacterized protein n=1 Tax=Entamoeba invadens IP1 TaxID=370355 RepID=A0A0A1TW74_ENTIV|nr:hypothetical protein EIN_174110 [Entamoeba invadens IP1]ELP84736.1 hypothetical protein EIN_174110 [Entamoeba invadens IP1]|eukprot:XP_004184082.1 hypothetical protein EIN_174110 [Entamoeba invadens IP1]